MRFSSYFSLFALLTVAVSTLLNAHQAEAQAGIELKNVDAFVRFGEAITFVATITSFTPLQTVSIVISDESQGITQVEPVTVQADGRTEFRFDTKQNVLRPFTTLKWNYQFAFSDGTTAQSQPFFVRYADDRFDWQTLESGALRLHWYHGDAGFGRAALDAAQAGLESIGKLLPPDLSQPIEIFIYTNVADLRGTLVSDSGDWIAGHADPGLGVIMVLIEPGSEQKILMEQRLPHELMHVLLYRRLGTGYEDIPVWLREGMATLVEMYHNTEYDRVLTDAVNGDRLIPLQDLCGPFPVDAGRAFLAYAESRSFTGYLHETYGWAGLVDLAAAYAEGIDCERGTERVFGVALSSLEASWRSSMLQQNIFLNTLQNTSPYLVLLCLVLIIPLVGMAISLRKKGDPNEPETRVKR